MAKVYNPTGDWTDLCNLFRCYNFEDILIHISQESIKLLTTKDNVVTCGARFVKFQITIENTKQKKHMTAFISAWDLIDVAYNAIIATNDFRGKKIQSEDSFWFLCAANKNYMQSKEKTLLEGISGKSEFWFYTWGFAGEQIKMQEISGIYENAAREQYILLEVSKRIDGINIPDVIREETSAGWEEVLASIILAWAGFNNNITLNEIIEIIKWDETYFEEILSYYLKEHSFNKIPVDKTERADWKIEIHGYSFLIEQKSTLVMLTAKQQDSDYLNIGNCGEVPRKVEPCPHPVDDGPELRGHVGEMHRRRKDDSITPIKVCVDPGHARVLLHTARMGLHVSHDTAWG